MSRGYVDPLAIGNLEHETCPFPFDCLKLKASMMLGRQPLTKSIRSLPSQIGLDLGDSGRKVVPKCPM